MNKKKLIILYIIISFIWIFGTNYLFSHFQPSHLIETIERIKELLYIFTTAWLFYYFIKKTEKLNNLEKEERRLSTLINSMVDFVNFKDGHGRWIEANEFGLKLFQLEDVDYKGKKDSELADYTEFYRDALIYCEVSDEEAWKNKGITRIEEVIPLPNGLQKTFDTIKVPLFHEDGSRKGLVIIGRDITERKLIENLLKRSRQKYKSLFEYNPDIVFMMNLNGVITNVNPQFKAVTGYDDEKVVGKKIKDSLTAEGYKTVKESISNILKGERVQKYELEIPHKNGETITIQFTNLPIIVNGEIEGIIGYGKDMTHIRQTEERLRQTEKLSVVGELAASVAHEIRNPLTSLIGFVQLLQKENEKDHLYHKIMLDELNRINYIAGELLLLAKPQQVQFTRADIHLILFEVISLLQSDANLYNVQIDYKSDGQEYMIDCEPNQLKQLFINIIKNAIEASSGKGTVSVYLKSKENNEVSIIIKDQGCGISEKRLEKIGEPFYSSKEKGTGLGLTVSFKIVQSHNGSIVFNSKINEGTEVLIKLPVTNDKKLD
ncbi:PAS domain S-box protein [Bacillus sp. DTU_2020_1000418_1_SI_GHA_SEK_038]|uniref:PAS domain S-box protein n=1 Tax=Bacillus sp. DTU_2020_1000418_1_SI_GHA_SEK_038 TaxID=3077585 RepID=UPI0028E7D62A|nr:PAS domain S-box protein [Bacillus sp. DTU_2020_1000418_1_SI_GHA_SEK_038]WNS76107.1 PAS domain S-box protein [Bacillus sp. DTU_2020_1000418_1_SI_GHA_SEK_038]